MSISVGKIYLSTQVQQKETIWNLWLSNINSIFLNLYVIHILSIYLYNLLLRNNTQMCQNKINRSSFIILVHWLANSFSSSIFGLVFVMGRKWEKLTNKSHWSHNHIYKLVVIIYSLTYKTFFLSWLARNYN